MKQVAITRKKAIIGAIVALLVLVVAGGVMVYVAYDIGHQEKPAVDTVSIEDVSTALDKYIADGRVDEGIEFVDSQIEVQENPEAKQRLLVQKSQFAAKAGRTDTALESAKEADSMGADIASSLALAEAYEKSGDKEQAVKYYQQVVDGIEKDTLMSRYRRVWEDKIKELSS